MTTDAPPPALTCPPSQAIMAREASNPAFSFVYDPSTPEHRYYRWKVVSLCCGDAPAAWDTAAFQLEERGPSWAPPPCSRPPPSRRDFAERDARDARDNRDAREGRDSRDGRDARDSRESRRSRRRSASSSSSRSRSRSPNRERERSERSSKFDRRDHRGGRGSPERGGRSPERRRSSPERGSRGRSPERSRGGGEAERREAERRERPRSAPAAPWERELTEEERDDLEDLLRGMVVERSTIKEGMGFCISKASSAAEISQTLAESLTLDATPAPKKIARLFLLSDVLHNSIGAAGGPTGRGRGARGGAATATGVPREASHYRVAFQKLLPEIFVSLHGCLAKLDSRMGVETMKQQVVKVLYIWQAWAVFPLSFLTKLEKTLLHGSPDGPKKASPAPAADAPPADCGSDSDSEDVDGEPMNPDAPPPAAAASAADGAASAAPPAGDAAAEAPDAVPTQEEQVTQLSLRALEAVCDANGLSSAGSRAEMLQRALAAVRAGTRLSVVVPPQQTLVVATRWDDNDDDDDAATAAAAPQPTRAPPLAATSPSTGAATPAAAPSLGLDAYDEDDLDGEPLDDLDGVPLTPAASGAALPSSAEAGLTKAALREIEGQLLAFADSLEAAGRSRAWVVDEVATERSRLVERVVGAAGRDGGSGGGAREGGGSRSTAVRRGERESERPRDGRRAREDKGREDKGRDGAGPKSERRARRSSSSSPTSPSGSPRKGAKKSRR